MMMVREDALELGAQTIITTAEMVYVWKKGCVLTVIKTAAMVFV